MLDLGGTMHGDKKLLSHYDVPVFIASYNSTIMHHIFTCIDTSWEQDQSCLLLDLCQHDSVTSSHGLPKTPWHLHHGCTLAYICQVLAGIMCAVPAEADACDPLSAWQRA